ncbi:DUF2625 domain-containing protein [Pedobacter sp. MW01-1-1]|uniref:DUF2625 domain-containing protein n=1 Tax=Pedobacter sp. MW01-1-1 TaxID=3383027 RepID=UPI003FEDD379
MKKIINCLLLALSVYTLNASAQNTLKPVEELINKTDPAWPLIQKWIDSAKNKVEILPVDSAKAKEALYQSQLNTYSTLGSVIYNTGGILVDNGWIRILGSGSERLNRSVPEWNKGRTFANYGDTNIPYLLIADDAVGGFFAINFGGLGTDIKNIYYLEPNTLNWQPLGAGYGEFMIFCFDSDLSKFYNGLRWSTWDKYIAKLDGNQVYNFYPPLWSEEGKDINKTSKKLVTIQEQFIFNLDMQKELQQKKSEKAPETKQ